MVLYALLGAPLAWFLLELAGWLLASLHCGHRAFHAMPQLTRATMPSFIVLAVVATTIAAGGLVMAWIAWQRARGEKSASPHHLMQVGEGRTHFVALVCVITSLTFTAGLVFYMIQMWGAPLCGS